MGDGAFPRPLALGLGPAADVLVEGRVDDFVELVLGGHRAGIQRLDVAHHPLGGVVVGEAQHLGVLLVDVGGDHRDHLAHPGEVADRCVADGRLDLIAVHTGRGEPQPGHGGALALQLCLRAPDEPLHHAGGHLQRSTGEHPPVSPLGGQAGQGSGNGQRRGEAVLGSLGSRAGAAGRFVDELRSQLLGVFRGPLVDDRRRQLLPGDNEVEVRGVGQAGGDGSRPGDDRHR